MRLPLFVLIGTLAASDAIAAQPTVQTPWSVIERTAQSCSTVAHQVRVPGLRKGTSQQAYSLDRHATREQRQCFYRKMNMSDVEKDLREFGTQRH
jgi:hypothetical protein